MKRKQTWNLLIITMTCLIILSGCSSKDDKSINNSKEAFHIGISQLAEHPALDDVRKGFEDGLKELGVNAKVDYQNAQGDIPTATSIAQKFIKDKVDLIFTIATPAAQAAKQATSDIPILFSAVTDPIQAEIVDSWENGKGNITGTSDKAPTQSQLEMFKQIDSNINTIGILYNTSESNSEVQVKEVKEIAPKLGLEVVAVGISNVNELPQALDSIIKKVDALYMITDNMVASSVELIKKKTLENKMITVSAEETQVRGGLLITNGLSYYELGKQTAKMAKEVLIYKRNISSIPVGLAEETVTIINENTLDILDLDKDLPLFRDGIKIRK